jgi:tetratricopeptide (TPR) repeat protein
MLWGMVELSANPKGSTRHGSSGLALEHSGIVQIDIMTNTTTIGFALLAALTVGCASTGTPRASTDRVDVDSHVVLGSLARERQNGPESAEHFLAAALSSDDPRHAALATEVAAELRLTALGLRAVERWQALSPTDPRVHQYLGIFRLRSGDTAAAVGEFSLLMEEAENYPATLAYLIQSISGEPDEQAATAVVRQLVAKYPGIPAGHYGLARLGLRSGNYQLALDNAEYAVELQPEWIEAQLLYARMLLIVGRSEEALAIASEIADEQPELEVRLQYAELLLSAGEHESARELLDDILSENPGLPEAIRTLALLTLTLNDLEASKGHFTDLRGQPRYRDEDFFYLGRIAELDEQPLQAYRSYSRVTAGSNAVEAQLRAANLLFSDLSDQNGALQHLRQFGLANTDYSTEMLVAETELLVQLDRRGEALQLISDAVTDSPNDEILRNAHVQLYISIAQNATGRDELDLAEDTLREALRNYRGDTTIRYAQALLYQEQGRNRRSASALTSLVRDQPNDAGLLNTLGYLLTDRLERHERALGYLEEALALEPDNAAIIDSMGWVLFNLGNFEAALSHLQRAYELFPDAEVAAHIVDTRWALGEHDQALELLRQKLEEDPDSPHLKELEQRLAP